MKWNEIHFADKGFISATLIIIDIVAAAAVAINLEANNRYRVKSEPPARVAT